MIHTIITSTQMGLNSSHLDDVLTEQISQREVPQLKRKVMIE